MSRIISMFSLLIETIIAHLLFGNAHSYLDLKLDIRVYFVLFGVAWLYPTIVFYMLTIFIRMIVRYCIQ